VRAVEDISIANALESLLQILNVLFIAGTDHYHIRINCTIFFSGGSY
jgi:hypothetical protein